jgi:hypothetical protein
VWSAPCPFLQKLIVLLATDLPASPFMGPDITFRLLCELEAEAECDCAPEPSRRAITRVRQWAGDSLARPKTGADRTQTARPAIYRTVYYSGSFAVGWTSSPDSLLSTIQTARDEMIRHGAQAAQIIEDDGLGAVVWSSARAWDES